MEKAPVLDEVLITNVCRAGGIDQVSMATGDHGFVGVGTMIPLLMSGLAVNPQSAAGALAAA